MSTTAPAEAGAPPDERELVRRARAGEAAAFGALALRHGRRLGGLCAALVGPAAAEDLVQDALLRAWRGLDGLDDPDRFAGWLLCIGRRLCLDLLRRRELERAAARTAPEAGPGEGPAGEAARGEARDRVRAAVAALAEPYREVIELYYYGASRYDEIALALGISPAGVNQRLTRARTQLRAALGGAR